MKQYISFLLLVFTGLACWSCKDDVERPALVTSEIELAVPKMMSQLIWIKYARSLLPGRKLFSGQI